MLSPMQDAAWASISVYCQLLVDSSMKHHGSFHSKTVAIAIVASALLGSCSDPSKSSGSTESSKANSNTSNLPPNAYKVLNRVECSESYSYCSQETINEIWKICLQKGYQLSTDSFARVRSSRDIKELVQETTQISVEMVREIPGKDHNGMLLQSKEIVKETVMQDQKVSGYCIGSEYISD